MIPKASGGTCPQDQRPIGSYTLGGVHRLSGWRAVSEHLERLPCGAGASTPVRGENSRPWPATGAAEAGDQTASSQAPETLLEKIRG